MSPYFILLFEFIIIPRSERSVWSLAVGQFFQFTFGSSSLALPQVCWEQQEVSSALSLTGSQVLALPLETVPPSEVPSLLVTVYLFSFVSRLKA